MNTRSRSLIAALLLSALFVTGTSIFAPTLAHAQEATATATATDPSAVIAPETAAAIATPFIVGLALKYPVVLTILAAMGALRFFFKPVMSLIEAYVKSTPSTADDAYFEKVQHTAASKWFAWFLDFGASIKVGSQFTAQPKK